MPTIRFRGQLIECEEGENLRRALMRSGAPLYNGVANVIHCRGLGTCGTCAVEIAGDVTPPTVIERGRLNFPPHSSDSGLRLACQCRVLGDVTLEKRAGLWGHRGTS
ncbi:MAG: 2Fe-2S iron-sulfur cluster-binding protein [Planctomycetota bacterium]